MAKAKKRTTATASQADAYKHGHKQKQRPDVGLQQEFAQRKPPKTYRYDSSLDPALSWDETRERELVEWLLGLIASAAEAGEAKVFATPQRWKGGRYEVASVKACVRLLQTLTKPFLNWAGKAERHEISVPTLPLFVHERHSTKAILETIRHRKPKGTTLDLFGDPNMDITDRLAAYEHTGPWANRMILGDSLQVMNSLLEFEGLGGQVQMIYIDPPYGVKFGSNFQPFVRKRDVVHGKDEDMIREPEMVKAYRDTWELGLHSYLTYLRDRLLIARELLEGSGSVFVQISDENIHHVREVMDEVFGVGNFCGLITFSKTTSATSELLPSTSDYLLWYSKDLTRVKYRAIYLEKFFGGEGASAYSKVELPDGTRRSLTAEEKADPSMLEPGSRIYRIDNLTSQRPPGDFPVELNGRTFRPRRGYWKTGESGMEALKKANRLESTDGGLYYVRFISDFPVFGLSNRWDDTSIAGFTSDKLYVVQTSPKVLQRCLLMTTDPGDLVFDPTCGAGTTAYVAEQWGRRWITCDTSRVPLALARQRLLTATFPYYELKDPNRGPAGGFVYKRKQNRKGEDVGGLIPHVTLKSIANNEEPKMEVLVDRPEVVESITRVTGPFAVEATIPAAADMGEREADAKTKLKGSMPIAEYQVGADPETHIGRMTEVLRQSKTLRLPGNKTLNFESVRRLNDAEQLHAEAIEKNSGDKRVAIVFGPEDGAVTSNVVFDAATEARHEGFQHVYFFGFAADAKALELMQPGKLKIPCMYVAVTPDVVMSDLLKTTRSSEVFSITGLPDADVRPSKQKSDSGTKLYEVEVRGLDIFNPAEQATESVEAENLPCWMLDTDYNGLSFCAAQVFFPKTAAWDNLKRALGSSYEDGVWDHLAGTVSEPFTPGEHKRIAVKVIDERGNELMVVRDIR